MKTNPKLMASVFGGKEAFVLLVLAATTTVGFAADPATGEALSLGDTVSPSAFHDARSGPLRVSGTARDGGVLVRVTTSLAASSTARVSSVAGKFACRYPDDFSGVGKLVPGALFIDATTNADFDANRPGHYQAEVTVIIHRGKEAAPLLPSGFMDDLLDGEGRRDGACAQWPTVRALANLYMRSRAARIVGVGRAQFDLEKEADLAWFKNNLTLYEFDYRDRDWSKPLNHRVARTFWQAVWNTWFNASNDHPLDGNPAHGAPTNYLPYAFANDFADLLIMELMRLQCPQPQADHLTNLCREATQNLLAMQHREPGNFALRDTSGRRENYTAGAFRYGLFENGGFMTEGKGWFYNPKFRDYEFGGVLNGRAIWALGEALRRDPRSPLVPQVRDALALALKFCLHDGAAGGYVKRTRSGKVYWRDAGEHAYLVLGMLAASEVAPDLEVRLSWNSQAMPLRKACVMALDALVELEEPSRQWTMYPNIDAMAVAALAEGAHESDGGGEGSKPFDIRRSMFRFCPSALPQIIPRPATPGKPSNRSKQREQRRTPKKTLFPPFPPVHFLPAGTQGISNFHCPSIIRKWIFGTGSPGMNSASAWIEPSAIGCGLMMRMPGITPKSSKNFSGESPAPRINLWPASGVMSCSRFARS